MKNWVKTVIWAVVGFCLVSALAGIFELFAFLQVAGQRIQNIGIDTITREYFTDNTIAAAVCAIVSVAMIVITVITMTKGSKNKKLVVALFALVLAISVFFIVFPFFTMEILKDEKFNAVRDDGMMYYPEYTHYQAYLSSTLSTFLPLLIAAGAGLGYYLFNVKRQNTAQCTTAETKSSEQNVE